MSMIAMNIQYITNSWPHRWYGIWKFQDDCGGDLPLLGDVIDLDWKPEDKQFLVSYLQDCPIILSAMSQSSCQLCYSRVASVCYRWDGHWLWADHLAHYIGSHFIVLPESFVRHIRQRNCAPPEEGSLPDVAVRNLPWPESYTAMRNWAW